MRQVEWNSILQVTYYSNGPIANLLFYCHIFIYWEQVTSQENLATSLPLKCKLSLKFQRLSANDGSIKMLKNSWISKNSVKMKNFTTFYEPHTTKLLRKLFKSTPDKSFLLLTFLQRFEGMSRHVFQLLENAVLGRLEMVQRKCFSDTNHKYFSWKFCKVSNAFGCVAEVYI